MSDELVKRLRDWEHVWPQDLDEPEGGLYLKAADRIEELEKRVNTFSEGWRIADEGRIEAEAKLSESEALLAKAVEALERIEDASKYFGNCPEASETTVRYAHETTRRLARNTLAELTSSVAADNEVKGGKDE